MVPYFFLSSIPQSLLLEGILPPFNHHLISVHFALRRSARIWIQGADYQRDEANMAGRVISVQGTLVGCLI